MRRRHRMISCLLCVICLLAGSLTGCAKEEKSEIPQEETVTLYNFEKGTAAVRMALQFGKIEPNETAEYVKEGKRSLKLSPSNTVMTEPYAYFPFESSLLGFNYDDITQMPEFTMDVYSTMDTSMNVGLYFSKAADLRSTPKTYELKQGWNKVTYAIDYSLISIQYNFTDCKGLYVSFDGTADSMPVVYLDDLVFKNEQADIVEEDLVRISRTENSMEICDFEHAYQNLAFFCWNTASYTPAPEFKIVRAADYGITAPSGEKVLQLKLNATTRPSSPSWTLLGLTKAVMDKFDVTQFAGELDQWVVKFDIYQAGEDSMNIGLDYLYGTADKYSGNSPQSVSTVKDEWAEYSCSMSGLTKFTENPYTMAISWYDPRTEADYVFYIDNIRLEKKSVEEEE